MRANQFIPEAAIGTHPKRPSREGSRPERGHEPQKRYVTDRKTGKQYDPDEEFDKLKNSPEFQAQMKRMAQKEGVAEGSLEEYGDTAKGQKMLTKVQKRAADRVVSKKADTDPKYAKKNSDTANRAWDRMTDKDLEESIDTILANLEEGGAQGPTSKKVCLSSVSDEALGVSQLASCKSQGLRARDGKKSHLIGHGSSKVRVTVGGKKIKGKAHGGPLPDYGTRKGQ